MKVLQLVEDFVFDSPAWRLILVVCVLMLFRTGIWYIPNLEQSRAIATNPFVNPITSPNSQYLYWNWLGPFLAWLIGAKSSVAFFLLHFAFSVAFSALFIGIVFSRFPDQLARSSFILFALLPVSATAYFWVSYDSITLFIMLVGLAYPQHALVTFLAGVGLGMQHFEQGFIAAVGLLVAVSLNGPCGGKSSVSLRFCFLLLAGAIVGKLTLVGLFTFNAVDVNSGRMHLLGDPHLALKGFFFHHHSVLWSILGLGWLVAVRYVDLGRETIPFFVTLFGLMVLLPVSGDQTRVLAIVTFPLVAAYWLFNVSFLRQIGKKEIAGIVLAWALMPWAWTWGGLPKWSVWPYDVAYVLHEVFGLVDVPTDKAEWPFQEWPSQ